MSITVGTASPSFAPNTESLGPDRVAFRCEADYPFSSTQAPFAVIADFNRGGALDVVTCGRDKEYSRLVAIVSQPAGFAVTTLDSSEATHPKEQTYDGETGLWLFLMAVTGEQIQPLGEAPVSVHGNAFQVVFYDKGTSAYVFENGRFTEYMTGD